MTDVLVEYVDNVLLERIRGLAKERQCSINEVMLHALRCGLGISSAKRLSESHRTGLGETSTDWADDEQGAFHEALQALARTRPTQFAPEVIGHTAEAGGAE